MTRALLALTSALAACGDGVVSDPPVAEPVSGSRLVSMWLGYDDGARQLRRDQVFDLVEQAACRPLRWADGVRRCTPIADEAVFADAACTRAVGRARTVSQPTHFIGQDRIDNVLVPTRLYRAGEPVDPLQVLFERRDGVCIGPFTAAGGLAHYAVEAEVPLSSLAPLDDDVIEGGDRLGMASWRSPDGLRLPASWFDRELGAPCDAAVDPDGRTRCRPRGAVRTVRYADPACTEPVLVVTARPAVEVVETVGDDGCPIYHRLGPQLPDVDLVFSGSNGGCASRPVALNEQVYATGGLADLAELERTVDDEPWRRLQRVVVTAGELRADDDRLYDTATRLDCRPVEVDGVSRCLPEAVATTSTGLFASPSCTVPTSVVELPQPLCGAPRFARAAGAPPGALQLVGDPRTATTYTLFLGCDPYPVPPGAILHDVGPVLDPELFVGAVLFGDR